MVYQPNASRSHGDVDMGWILTAVFIIWLISRCNGEEGGGQKDDLSGDSVGSLFLLENLIDYPERDEEVDNTNHDSGDDLHSGEWLDHDEP